MLNGLGGGSGKQNVTENKYVVLPGPWVGASVAKIKFKFRWVFFSFIKMILKSFLFFSSAAEFEPLILIGW